MGTFPKKLHLNFNYKNTLKQAGAELCQAQDKLSLVVLNFDLILTKKSLTPVFVPPPPIKIIFLQIIWEIEMRLAKGSFYTPTGGWLGGWLGGWVAGWLVWYSDIKANSA